MFHRIIFAVTFVLACVAVGTAWVVSTPVQIVASSEQYPGVDAEAAAMEALWGAQVTTITRTGVCTTADARCQACLFCPYTNAAMPEEGKICNGDSVPCTLGTDGVTGSAK